MHARFAAYTAKFLEGYVKSFPTDATTLGDHTHDGEWPDLSVQGEAALLKTIDSTRAELATFPLAELDEEDRADASILANELDATRFFLVEERDNERLPMTYSGILGDGLDALISRDFAPLDVRMKSLDSRLRGLPAVVAAAKARLAHPAKVNTETALEQVKGLVALCENDVPPLIKQVPAQAASLEQSRQIALAALRDFVTFLHDDLLPRSDGSFRDGPQNFAKVLRFRLDDPTVDPDALLKEAKDTIASTRAEMLTTALQLWSSLMTGPVPQPKTEAEKSAAIRAVLDKLAEDHLDDDTIVPEAKRMLDSATDFVRTHELMTLPDEACKVIVMPEYKRGFSTAYCDSSGPLEKKQLTYVAISPPPADWPAERRLSQYREYNRSMMAELLVHEAMPGHYLQAMHANRFHSDIRAVFHNGAFAEGWAVYGEWLMAKYGFGGPKVHMEQLKMLLRVATNAILDHDIQAGSMGEKEALDLMQQGAFQEEGEAVGKWRRARLGNGRFNGGQLTTYFYGFRELMKIREAVEKQPGFAEHAYNDNVIAFGTPPIRVIRDRFLGAH
jgi:uncharacterized protein (DUF885 family)